MDEEDVLMLIHNKLMEDPFVLENAAGRIKFYEYPATGEVTAPYIVIDPLDAPMPSDFADDTWLTLDYLLQIDVWATDRQLARQLSFKVIEVMWTLNFGQSGGTGDDWDKDTGIFSLQRRFRGKIYRNIIEGEENINANN